ncbi:DNA internalization-related competence protein ComEC/Rec2 [Arsukibacterium indicum]|uniref:DNA internalization-related competence protein ComEC/Rec2 n=1 Tax=Arsukibacterium indicum TaxID=2848612 RepID=A0ABS6MI01_9GAMM|nr:DNA internalization-related competence protein ComEC/Rec2 [Arsukibacterium indicum]MBV2128427.1 DNA internalization-related competence protein ComEC/Rec2 [Arsukibacterium indicum]
MSLFLPIVPPFFSIFFVMLFLTLFIRRRLYLLLLLGAASFLASWSWQYHQYQAAQQAMLHLPGAPVLVKIDTTPKHYPDYTQLSATVVSGPAAGYRLALRWQQPPALASGQYWRLRLHLKPVHGVANPAGFNSQTHYYINSLVASGFVARGPQILLGQQHSVRQQIVARVEQATYPYRTEPLLKALAVGEREFLDTLWQGAQHSGLGHLLAISGLHIGLVFGWVLWLGGWSKGLLAIRRQQQLVLICALAAALLYAWLASFAIPTLRAVTALSILVICRSQLVNISLSRFWLLFVALMLLVQPFWVLSASFWLSVLAVAIIFIVIWRYPLNGTSWQAKAKWFLLFHLVLSLLMTLLGVVLFGGFSPLMLLSNLLFVPWCSLIAIPLLLVSLFLTVVGLNINVAWQLTDLAFMPLLWWLEHSAGLQVWWPVSQASALSVALTAVLLILMLIYSRKAALLLLPLCILFLSGSALQPRHWQLHLLDSGQRQLILLQRGSVALLYDLAPAGAIQDIAEQQLRPVLRQQGIHQLDIVLFRQQRSERGRQWAKLTNYQSDQGSLTQFSQQLVTGGCSELPTRYQDVAIEVLIADNADSCIIRLTIGHWRVLIPGKISTATEQALIAGNDDLRADILVLANNGSATVNSLALLEQVRPVLALNAAAFMNGYQHPATAVEQRLALLRVPLLNTADYGAIRLEFTDENIRVSSWRQQRMPFWLEKPPPIAETLATTR